MNVRHTGALMLFSLVLLLPFGTNAEDPPEVDRIILGQGIMPRISLSYEGTNVVYLEEVGGNVRLVAVKTGNEYTFNIKANKCELNTHWLYCSNENTVFSFSPDSGPWDMISFFTSGTPYEGMEVTRTVGTISDKGYFIAPNQTIYYADFWVQPGFLYWNTHPDSGLEVAGNFADMVIISQSATGDWLLHYHLEHHTQGGHGATLNMGSHRPTTDAMNGFIVHSDGQGRIVTRFYTTMDIQGKPIEPSRVNCDSFAKPKIGRAVNPAMGLLAVQGIKCPEGDSVLYLFDFLSDPGTDLAPYFIGHLSEAAEFDIYENEVVFENENGEIEWVWTPY